VAERRRRPARTGRRPRREPADTLAGTVQRLGEELAGLRRAQRSRAVIEQAKGILMGRQGGSAEDAFAQLLQISQQTNTRVAEVAAGLLSLTSPVLPERSLGEMGTADLSELPGELPPPQLPLPDQEAARYHLACAAMSAARAGDEVADALLSEGLRPLGGLGVVLAVREPDGAIRLVGSRGLSRGLASAWQRVPAGLNVGFLRAIADGRPLWLDRAEATAAGLELLGDGDFRACLPLRRGREVFGVAAFTWARDPHLDLTARAYVTALSAAAGRRLDQLNSRHHGTVAASGAHWLDALLQALPGSFALLSPVRDDAGAVVDWCFDKSSPDARDAAGRPGEQLIGRRLLELYPDLADGEILRCYDEVLRSGRPFTHGPAEQRLAADPHGAAVTVTIRAARFGDGILISWRHGDPDGRLTGRIARVLHAVPAGWAEWNLRTGESTWAAETGRILGCPEPVELTRLHRCATAGDAAAVTAAVRAMLDDRRAADLTVRFGPPGAPAVRMVMEPVADGQGRLIGVCAAFCVIAGRTDGGAPGPVGTVAEQRSVVRHGDGPALLPAAESVLTATARRLRAEMAQLRRTQQAQALIDQATGVLSARLRCSVDEAFERLSRAARRRGMPLVAAAAEVLSAPVPARERGDGLPPEPAFRPELYVGRPVRAVGSAESAPPPPTVADDRLRRVRVAMEAAPDGDTLAAALWAEGLRGLGATGVVLGVLEPDGAVRLVGTHGLPGALVSAWRRTPGNLNVAYLRAVATDTALWITRREAERHGYQLLGEGELRACLPLHEGGGTFGVASVLWDRDEVPDAETREYVSELADACGRRLSRLLRSGAPGTAAVSPAAHWAGTVVAALPAGYALMRPVRGTGDEVIDWCFEACSPETVDLAGRGPDAIVGRHLRDLYPHAGTSGIIETYTAAMRTGAGATWGPTELEVLSPRGPATVTVSVRAARFGDGVLVHWARHDERRRLERRLDLLQRAADCGWADWDLTAGRAFWSAAAYDILHRDRRSGPIKLGALHRCVAPEDQAAMADAVHALIHHRAPVDRVLTLRRHGQSSRIRFAAQPVLDHEGRLSAVHAVVQRLPEH
jgi:AmiR/NasT family two-component response regulator